MLPLTHLIYFACPKFNTTMPADVMQRKLYFCSGQSTHPGVVIAVSVDIYASEGTYGREITRERRRDRAYDIVGRNKLAAVSFGMVPRGPPRRRKVIPPSYSSSILPVPQQGSKTRTASLAQTECILFNNARCRREQHRFPPSYIRHVFLLDALLAGFALVLLSFLDFRSSSRFSFLEIFILFLSRHFLSIQ